VLEGQLVFACPPNPHDGVEAVEVDAAIPERSSRAAEDRSAPATNDRTPPGDSQAVLRPAHGGNEPAHSPAPVERATRRLTENAHGVEG
jgi:hypothetical protein